MIITSTNDVQGYCIIRYLGLINVNVVIGTNLISDFLASFSDMFGGYSETYQSKLDRIYNAALNALTKKAQSRGADAIIGVNFEFDEISSKGKSMFMVTAYGTIVKTEPVKFEVYKRLYNLSKFKKEGIITEEQYEKEKQSEVEKINLIHKNEELKEKMKAKIIENIKVEEGQHKSNNYAFIDDFEPV